jgi:hypothetical protein
MRLATQEEVTLFALMGQALLNIQVLEECLSASITLKVDVGYPRKASKAEADELLKKRRAFTLGKAIQVALKEELYADDLQKALVAFLDERNWLVHKSIDDIYAPTGGDALFQRIKNIALEAHRIQRAIEDDLIVFSESNGMDMSRVRAAIRGWYHGPGQ